MSISIVFPSALAMQAEQLEKKLAKYGYNENQGNI